MLGAFIAVVETCGDIGVLSPFSARKSCCGSSYHINLDSSNVRSLGKYPFGANLCADMSPSILAMGVGGGIRIYSWPSLSLLSEIKTNGVVMDVKIYNDHLFVANGLEGLLVYDISSPSSPSLVYWYDSPGYAKGIKIYGDRLYLSDGEFGVKIFDISSPSSPALIGSVSTVGDATETDLYGNYLIVGEGSLGIEIFDISSVSSPVKVSDITSIGDVRSVRVGGDRLFVALGTNGLRVYDISDPTSPTLVSSISTPYKFTGVELDGYLFVSAMMGGLRIIDPSTASEITSSSTYGPALKSVKVGNLVLVSEDIAGLEIFDVSDPANPVLQAFIPAEGCFYDVKSYGGKIFAAAGSKGIKSFTYTLPNINKITEQIGGYLLEVFPYNGYIFAAAGTSGGLRIYDTASLNLVGYYDTPGSAKGVFVSGNYAFVADGLYGVRIIDVSDVTNPVEVSYYDSPGVAHSVYVYGNLMFVADGPEGLRIVDISDPLTPVEISYYNTPGNAMGIHVEYPYVFLADGGSSGIRVINVLDPSSPYEIAQYLTPGEAKDVYYRYGYIYVADGVGGFRVLNASNLPSIFEIGYYDTPWSAQSVFVDDFNRSHVADLSAGFMVLGLDRFSGISEISVPDYVEVGGGKGSITLRLISTYPGNSSIKVYNTSGKVILSKDYRIRRGENKISLEFSHKGVFILKINLPSGRVRSGIVVVR